jgi:hypothetical protein
MLNYLIYFCCYLGTATEPDGYILITDQQVEAFGVTWQVTDYNLKLQGKSDTSEDHIKSGGIGLEYITPTDTIQAHLGIYQKNIVFVMDGEVAKMKRIDKPIITATLKEF